MTAEDRQIAAEDFRAALDVLPPKLNAIADEWFGELCKDLDREPSLVELAEALERFAREQRSFDHFAEVVDLEETARGVRAMAAAEAADPEPLTSAELNAIRSGTGVPVSIEVTPRGARMIERQQRELAEEQIAEELDRYLDDAIDALENLARTVGELGGRDSANPVVRSFAAYHLADLEGVSAGWLGRGLLVDALRELKNGGVELEAGSSDPRASWPVDHEEGEG